MKTLRSMPLVVALLLTVLSASFTLAEKPDWAGQGKSDKHEQKGNEKHKDKNKDKREETSKEKKQKYSGETADIRVSTYFTDPQRLVIRDYYGKQYKAGRCPPGLAKKNNGCMPPGQAKKWAVGQPLPGNVVYYPIPPSIVVQLGVAPVGHKYVRVASDILLIAIGTSLIVDAIEDLGRL